MSRKQELRAEETKQSILAAATQLFGERGYDTVTMREIAKQAGCSHTTIYIYFHDKEALLHLLSMPPLDQLKQQLTDILHTAQQSAEQKWKAICKEMVRFCFMNKTMYPIFFNVRAVRVDEQEPELPINKLRNELFALLTRALQQCLQIDSNDERLLAFSRICYYTMHGIIGTYTHSEESAEQLLERLSTTFDTAFETLLLGFRQKLHQGDNHHENHTTV
ncbi:TetR/AcrR family transcriptional regulator [Paenibacillus sp. GCM10027626]|uniref:TetR/AcrR family transcriptional regulator n=1 Tax=Paenibacillus sp. GCM10027626 TaxID=3273411 RepID=UPI003642587B